ncbi:TIGR03767 family metallophosphoesterase [Ochrobactrum sp. AN78]|uniref:TIGR03767 family metallophosphoesterase n=1 Tax=Ochrobactrum sp. AN78 TaxID=3039853 RepID=UPI002989E24B|nr:TIGR03767 family metallophosphoesterase [Ochrobactrum sp. AN78]MDH7793788.1 metallophosphoesterase (TIGR03767 family) [Ochrobactrum sp. AN78]
MKYEPIVSRRSFLKAGLAASTVSPLAMGICNCGVGRANAQDYAATAVTTLDQTLVPGDYLTKGKRYRKLTADNPLPILVREDLAGAKPQRDRRRSSIAAFVHLTDLHIIDAASPSHAAFMRQFGGLNGVIDGAPLSNAWRPHDTLTLQVLDAMVRRVNAVQKGPVSGRPFDFAISTGDNADTRAMHELQAVVTTLNGGVTSMSAADAPYVGIQDNAVVSQQTYDAYWHPEPSPGAQADDLWKRAYGYPVVEGFLSAINRPVVAQGLDMPWYTGFGNHDELDFGVFSSGNVNAFTAAIGVGNRAPVSLPRGMSASDFIGELVQGDGDIVEQMIASLPARIVKAAPTRRPFTKTEFIKHHLDSIGRHGPRGHGFSEDNLTKQNAYYRFRMAERMTGIMLDTTNPQGGPDGSLDINQAQWLEVQLRSVSSSYLTEDGTRVSTGNTDELVAIFSHHNSITFDNFKGLSPAEHGVTRLGSDAFLALLARYPNVILWVNGHTHCNRIWSHFDPHNDGHGIWEINTAAHIDYPQQSRTIEIVDNADGTLSIFAVVIDHSSPDSILRGGPQTQASLAALSLELAMNDPALDRAFRLGAPEDQNVELLINKPFDE